MTPGGAEGPDNRLFVLCFVFVFFFREGSVEVVFRKQDQRDGGLQAELDGGKMSGSPEEDRETDRRRPGG